MNILKNQTTPKVKTDLRRYYLKDRIFDHPTEYEFYKLLREDILGERFVAMVQIPVLCLVGVRRRHEPGWLAHFGRIKSKRIDYLICRKENLKPLLALELDGSTHDKEDRQERDIFINSVFASVGLPVLHVFLQSAWNKAAVALSIAKKLGLEARVIRRLESQAGVW